MEKEDRVRLLFAIRDKLAEGYSGADAFTLLDEFGISYPQTFEDYSLLDVLRTATDEELLAVSSFLFAEDDRRLADAAAAGAGGSGEPLLVFASHQSNHKALVGEVAAEMARFGITLFVAHVDIEPHAAWRNEIIRTLRTCHAGVAFIHNEFKTSDWCDQEVGWLLGRGVPVITLAIDLAPYGPMGEKQAIPATDLHAGGIAAAVIKVLVAQHELQPHLAASLTSALVNSANFQTTDQIWSLLRNFRNLDAQQCARVLEAVEENDQVYRAHSAMDGGRPYAEVMLDFLRQQTGVSEVAARLEEVQARRSND